MALRAALMEMADVESLHREKVSRAEFAPSSTPAGSDSGAGLMCKLNKSVEQRLAIVLHDDVPVEPGPSFILNHFLEVYDRGSDNLFASRHQNQECTKALRLEALAWYRNSLLQARGVPGADLLELGEFLTRDHELAGELLRADLVDRLLEASGDDDPCVKALANQTLLHLVEDSCTLYHGMVEKIEEFMRVVVECNVHDFLAGLSSLVYRDPAAFLRASSHTCDFVWDSSGNHDYHLVRLKKHRRSSEDHTSSGLTRELVEHLLPRLEGEQVALELLTGILEELPAVSVQAAIDAGAVERVFDSSTTWDELLFFRFVQVLERQGKTLAITRAMLAALSSSLSSRELDITKLNLVFRRMQPCCEYVDPPLLRRMLDTLGLLDPGHLEASEAAVSALEVLERVLTKYGSDELPERSFQGPYVSDASVREFCFHQRWHAQCMESTSEENDGGLEEDDSEEWLFDDWRFTSEHLETLARFFWLPPRSSDKGVAHLAYVLEEFAQADHPALSRLLLDLLRRPASTSGVVVPEFAMRRVFRFQWRLFRKCGFHFEKEVAMAYISLAIDALKVTRRWSSRLLKVIVLQFMCPRSENVSSSISLSLSDEQVHTLCHFAVFTSDSLLDSLVSLVSLYPSLSQAFLSSIAALSTQVSTAAVEKLHRGDHSCSAPVVRLVRLFERLVGQHQQQEQDAERGHLARALDPLWKFIHVNRLRKARPLIEAFFIAQALSLDPAPSELALELLRGIIQKKLVKLALPMLRKWPSLASLDFSTKLEFARASFEVSWTHTALEIARDNVLRDSYEKFSELEPEWLSMSSSISVEFVGEQGCDRGGLTREWYQLLSAAIGKELFTAAGNPRSASPLGLSYFSFAGRLVAKAIVDDKRLDVRFSRSFYKHLLGQQVTYEDIEDADCLRNLNWLLENHVDESMALTFSVDVQAPSSQMTSYDLVPGGSHIPVTDANKHEYVKLLAEYLLSKSFQPELDAFLAGFYELVPRNLISIFLPSELELLICGLPEINIGDWKLVAKCRHEHQILKWFWEICDSFDDKKKALLSKFVTGSSKIPFGGLKQLYIASMEGGDEYLPTSHTCINEILLPFYKDKKQLEHKLLLAMHEGCESFQLA